MGAEVLNNQVSAGFSIFDFIKKHWLLCIFMIFFLPAIVNSIRVGIHEQNYSKPLFELAGTLLLSDNQLYDKITQFEVNPELAIGKAKGESLFNNLIYYLYLFWFIFTIMSYVSFITFPLMILYKLISLGDQSQNAKNFMIAFVIFLVYLLVTNCIITTYNMASGNLKIDLSQDTEFMNYGQILMNVMPFHGLYTLGSYIFRTVFVS